MPKKPKTLAFWKNAAKSNPFRRPPDWSNEADWVDVRDALNLDSTSVWSEKWNAPVRKAFKDFGLDPNNPYDWRHLLTLYVHSHRSRGRPVEWDGESLCDLLRAISKFRKKNPNAKRSDIYRSLTKERGSYSGKTEDYLKHGHRLALNPERNHILRSALDLVAAGHLDVLRVGYQEQGRAITSSDKARIKRMDSVLEDALEFIGAPNSGLKKLAAIFRPSKLITVFFRRRRRLISPPWTCRMQVRLLGPPRPMTARRSCKTHLH
jgi:hypothetical protein